jgi:Bacterial antitoxin of type II TA system, VapB
MTKTLIDVDDDALNRARTILGARTKKDAVNGSLREVVRLAAIREFRVLVGDGSAEPVGGGLVLVDASALAHCARPEVAGRLVPLLVLDRLATCAAVEHEAMTLAGNGADAPLAALRRVGLRWLATDDADLRRAAEIQAELTS